MQEVQSRASMYATNLDVGRGFTNILHITCDQLTLEKEDKKKCTDRIEQGITSTYNYIIYSTQTLDRSVDKKIKIIVQKIEGYIEEIEDLK
jgi:hypothetical protein